jgi:hypothetical protein
MRNAKRKQLKKQVRFRKTAPAFVGGVRITQVKSLKYYDIWR